jgi:hypothetical protein
MTDNEYLVLLLTCQEGHAVTIGRFDIYRRPFSEFSVPKEFQIMQEDNLGYLTATEIISYLRKKNV